MGTDVLPRPPEMETAFVEDIASIVPHLKDEADERLLDAAKLIIDTYLRSDLDSKELRDLYGGTLDGYKEIKKGKPNETLISNVQKFIDHADQLKGKIKNDTSMYLR